MTQPPSESKMDSSATEEGRDHNENKEGFTSLERKESDKEYPHDLEMDSTLIDDGRDQYENKGVLDLSKGNKQYLMLVHPDDGDEDEGLDSDEKIDDSLDIEGHEFGYRTTDNNLDPSRSNQREISDVSISNQGETNDVNVSHQGETTDRNVSQGETFDGNVSQGGTTDVSVLKQGKISDAKVEETKDGSAKDDDVFVNDDKDKLTDRKVGVSYPQQQASDGQETNKNDSETKDSKREVTESLNVLHKLQGGIASSYQTPNQGQVTLGHHGEVNHAAYHQREARREILSRSSVSSDIQSNSSDNIRNLGYRDSYGSDISLPDLPERVVGEYHKVKPLPIADSDAEDYPNPTHHHESAKVSRRKTWGSLDFKGFFSSKNRQTGVQRRSSVAVRPVITKSASQADILCGECEYCVSLPQQNRLLQTQLDKTEKDFKKKEDDLTSEIKVLKKENERQQKLIGQNLTLGPEAKIEATMQHEITRLTGENLDLRETIDKQTDQIRKLKKMLKVYSRKLKDGEAAEIQAELEREELSRENGGLATVKHRQRIYLGMLEYRKEDEGVLLKSLILDLKPKVASGLLPGLPSYLLFMCVRHTDYTNDDEKVRSLLTGTINSIKKVVKKHPEDMERYTLWLANTCRMLHTLKQYSGEKTFQSENTTKQNEQCLRNFDLSDYRQVFSDLAVWIYQGLIKLMQELIQPNIVPAVLEHEAIAGLTASKPSGLRGRTTSNARELDDDEKAYSLDSLMRALNSYMKIVTQHAVDPELVKQIFRQLYYFICAGALNNLLLRKDMCNWSKGMQIRYNISHLEQWLRDNKLHESGASTTLETIIQASQLLQARKTDADVESVCEMCSKLTLAQVIKILNLYTPVDEFEERVPISFIRKIQEKLKHKQGPGNTLLMETKFSYPVTFPFNPSSIALETIEVPEQLHLGFVKRI